MTKVKVSQLSDSLKREIAKRFDDTLKGLNSNELEAIGKIVVQEIENDVLKGINPISGFGARRFPEYKNPSNYPDKARKDFPAKRRRPVNLFLSGDFLFFLRPFVKGQKIFIGFSDPLSIKKEQGHRDGANGQPKRPIIPQGSETFNKRIIRVIKEAFSNQINKKLAK